jgi:ABC-type polysaccharide transport system permease subunit
MSQEKTISQIAVEIKKTWKNVNFTAVPYLNAMMSLETINDTYYEDSASDIVLRFLSNAQTWRGDDARRIKKELIELVK